MRHCVVKSGSSFAVVPEDVYLAQGKAAGWERVATAADQVSAHNELRKFKDVPAGPPITSPR